MQKCTAQQGVKPTAKSQSIHKPERGRNILSKEEVNKSIVKLSGVIGMIPKMSFIDLTSFLYFLNLWKIVH